MKIYLISLCILANAIGNNGDFSKINCRNKELDANGCVCHFENSLNFSVLECLSMLPSNLNVLPSLPGNILRVINSFDRWPIIPVDAKNKTMLILSENQIDSIDDLTNLENLEFFNISYNKIKKIDSSLSALQKLSVLDLSYNFLEQFHFEDLVPNANKNSFNLTQPIFSGLSFLFLNGNQIKQIFNFDLVFVAMPLCNFVVLNDNMLTSLDVYFLSQQSQNVIEKVKQALVINDSYLDIFEIQKDEGYYYGFKKNSIKRFNVDFKVILNDVFKGHKKNFLTRFLSISLVDEKNNILCDCNAYLEFDFLKVQLVEVYGHQEIPDGDLQSFDCFQKDSNKSLNLFDLINEYQVNSGNFCAGNSPEYKWTTYDLNDTSHSISAVRQIRYFPLFFVEIIFLRLFLIRE
jgi:hypothetical protein